MHELSLAQNIIEIVMDTIKDKNGAMVSEVGVDIGELIAVVPESLEFCYETLIENTVLSGSRLRINILPIKGKCASCGNIFDIRDMNFFCPVCQSSAVAVQQGQELKISYLEVD